MNLGDGRTHITLGSFAEILFGHEQDAIEIGMKWDRAESLAIADPSTQGETLFEAKTIQFETRLSAGRAGAPIVEKFHYKADANSVRMKREAGKTTIRCQRQLTAIQIISSERVVTHGRTLRLTSAMDSLIKLSRTSRTRVLSLILNWNSSNSSVVPFRILGDEDFGGRCSLVRLLTRTTTIAGLQALSTISDSFRVVAPHAFLGARRSPPCISFSLGAPNPIRGSYFTTPIPDHVPLIVS